MTLYEFLGWQAAAAAVTWDSTRDNGSLFLVLLPFATRRARILLSLAWW